VEDLEKEGYGEYVKLFNQDPSSQGPSKNDEISKGIEKTDSDYELATFAAGCFCQVNYIYLSHSI
jgi:hypothetical protein